MKQGDWMPSARQPGFGVGMLLARKLWERARRRLCPSGIAEFLHEVGDDDEVIAVRRRVESTHVAKTFDASECGEVRDAE